MLSRLIVKWLLNIAEPVSTFIMHCILNQHICFASTQTGSIYSSKGIYERTRATSPEADSVFRFSLSCVKMKFVESILSNNTTDDHCQEFVNQKGLLPLVSILGLPNLPIDFPTSAACQAVAGVCKSILVR